MSRFPFRRERCLLPVATLLLVVAAGTPGRAAADDVSRALDLAHRAADLVRRLEAAYRKPPFRISFVQSLDSATFGLEEQARGTVHVVAPGRMLWLYDEPPGQKAFMEPDRWVLLSPEDREVTIRERDPGRPHPVADLLAGTIDLLRLFSVTIADEPPRSDGLVRLELVPRQVLDEIDLVQLEVDPRRAELRRVTVIDPLGSKVVYELGARVPEKSLPDAALEVDVPPGYAVSRE